jgi:dynein heavy chain
MNYLTFAICWSLGANLHDTSRQAFSDKFRQEMKKRFLQYPDGDIYDYGIDPETHKLQPWVEKIPTFQYDPAKSFFDILVPTGDTTKYMFLLNTLLGCGFNVLITGETGVGKSVITKEFLNNAPEHIVSASVNFSGKTTTKNLQDAFEGNL